MRLTGANGATQGELYRLILDFTAQADEDGSDDEDEAGAADIEPARVPLVETPPVAPVALAAAAVTATGSEPDASKEPLTRQASLSNDPVALTRQLTKQLTRQSSFSGSRRRSVSSASADGNYGKDAKEGIEGKAVAGTAGAGGIGGQGKVVQTLMAAEERGTGSVGADIYLYYLNSAGSWALTAVVVLSMVVAQGLQIAINLWLNYWSTDAFGRSIYYYIWVYGVLTAANVACLVVSSTTLAFVAARVSQTFHDRAFSALLSAPMAFFDTTPLGRIVNRFSGDMGTVDTGVSPIFLGTVLSVLSSLFSVGQIIAVFWYMAVPLVPLAALFWSIQAFFRKTSVELQRLVSLSKSPVLAHFGEVLSGLPTIRAYQEQGRFIVDNERKLYMNQKCQHGQNLTNFWLSIRLQLIGAVITGCVSGLAVYFATTGLSPGLIALVLQYGLSMSSMLSPLIQQLVGLENAMNSYVVSRDSVFLQKCIRSARFFSRHSHHSLIFAPISTPPPARRCRPRPVSSA